MKYWDITFLFTVILLFSLSFKADAQLIRYVAVGDSYTIGTGIQPEESWPSILTKKLSSQGIPIEITANLGKNGWTTQDVINAQLPIYKTLKPDFATLLIGVNDWVKEVDAKTFRLNLGKLMDDMITQLPQKDHLVVITIPDFSVTPTGSQFALGRNIPEGIAEFNSIIIEEAKRRNLKVVDIYPLTQKMKDDRSLIAEDGLHPSSLEYQLWEKLIYPEAEKILRK